MRKKESVLIHTPTQMATLSIPISHNVFSAGYSSTGRRRSPRHSSLQLKCSGKNSSKLCLISLQLFSICTEFSIAVGSDVQSDFTYSGFAGLTDGSKCNENVSQFKELRNAACGILAVWAVASVSPVIAANQVTEM